MKESNKRLVSTIEISSYEEISQSITSRLDNKKVARASSEAAMLVFEEIFLRLVDSDAKGRDVGVEISGSVNGVTVWLEFKGDKFYVDFDEDDEFDPGMALLREYRDRLTFTYIKGVNRIGIQVRRVLGKPYVYGMISILLAIPVYCILTEIPLNETTTMMDKFNELVVPLKDLFLNAVLMLTAPITFVAIIRNITSAVVDRDSNHSTLRLLWRIISSSVAALVSAFLLFKIYERFIFGLFSAMGAPEAGPEESSVETFLELLYNSVPSDIFNAFTVMSPFPLIILSVLAAAALCTLDKYYEPLRDIVDAIDAWLNSMMAVVMAFMPLACFLQIIHGIYNYGFQTLVNIFVMSVLIFFSCLVILILYGSQLAAHKINPFKYYKRVMPAVLETVRIGSTEDAAPYNSRFLRRTFGLDRKILAREMPVLAQVNLDGNCFVVMLTSLLVMTFWGVRATGPQALLIGVIIIAFSMGAPNQAGTLIIGFLAVFYFMDMSDCAGSGIFCEVILGNLVLALNTIGDMVVVTCSSKRAGKYREPITRTGINARKKQ